MSDYLKRLVHNLAGQRILVVGDIILDEYLTGKAVRMSREAPVPVLEFESRRLIPGGAANPAVNIAALGSTALQVGVVGSDANAASLRALLHDRGIDTAGLFSDPTRPTTVKTRIMAQMGLRFPQQVARLDTLSRESVAAHMEHAIIEYIGAHLNSVNAILLSDYHTGLLTPSLVGSIKDSVRQHNLTLTADAQGELAKYTGYGLVKCNADEAQVYLRRRLVSAADFEAAAAELCRMLNLTGGMVITRGGDGATLATAQGETAHCPAPSVTDVYDTVGAGDTAIAVLTLAIAAGAAYQDAAVLANYASGLVVRRVGNYAPSTDELLWALATWSG